MRNLSPEAKANQQKAQNEWHKENLERISLSVPKGRKAVYKALAEKNGVSLNKLIMNCLDELAEKEDISI